MLLLHIPGEEPHQNQFRIKIFSNWLVNGDVGAIKKFVKNQFWCFNLALILTIESSTKIGNLLSLKSVSPNPTNTI
jgi:hypothetical protein